MVVWCLFLLFISKSDFECDYHIRNEIKNKMLYFKLFLSLLMSILTTLVFLELDGLLSKIGHSKAVKPKVIMIN